MAHSQRPAARTSNYVSMLERGERCATLEVAERLAQPVGVPLEKLIAQTRRKLGRSGVSVPKRA